MKQPSKSVVGYDRLAPWYQILERLLFGDRLNRARTALVDRLPAATKVLVLGDGDGRLLECLVRRRPECTFISIDQSPQMVAMQKRRLDALGDHQVEFICHDVRHYPLPANDFHLIVTAFFLDCFTKEQLAQHLPTWIDSIVDEGHLYLVDFIRPKRGWRIIQSSIYQWIMHRFFRWQTGLENKTLVDLEGVLVNLPIDLVEAADDVHPMMTSRLYRVTRP